MKNLTADEWRAVAKHHRALIEFGGTALVMQALATMPTVGGVYGLSAKRGINRVVNATRAAHIKDLAKRAGTTVPTITQAVDRLHGEFIHATAPPPPAGDPLLDALDGAAPECGGSDRDRLQRIRRELEENNEPPKLFKRDGLEVRLRMTEAGARVETLTGPAWTTLVTDLTGTLPDSKERDYFRGVSDWNFPYLKGLVSVPVFTATGELRTQPGYDPASKTYLLDGFEMLEIPATITRDHVKEATDLLLDPLCDFPLTDCFDGGDDRPQYADKANHVPHPDYGPSARAHILALALQPFCRSLITGPVPGVHLDKQTHGEGGTMVLQHPGIIFTGRPMPVTPYVTNPGEQQKQLLALLRTGPAYLMFDNATGEIDSADLAAMITESLYQGRLLGKTEVVTCEVVGSVIFNGVNVNFSAELTRRMLPIRLASRHHAPESRKGPWKYPNFTAHLMENRAKLVWAAHVLIGWWLQQGAPEPKSAAVMGSFEGWVRVMGGVLEAAEVPGFLGNLKAYQVRNAEGRGDERTCVEMLAGWFPDRAFSASDILSSVQLRGGNAFPGVKLDERSHAEHMNKIEIANHVQGRLARVWRLTNPNVIRGVLGITGGQASPVPDHLHVEVVRVRERSPAEWRIKVVTA